MSDTRKLALWALNTTFVVLFAYFVLGTSLASAYLFIVASVPSLWVHTLVHELSHTLAALWLGFELQTVDVWPFRVQVKPRLGLRLAQSLGAVTASPRSLDRLFPRVRLFAGAGLAANGLLFAASIAIWVSTSRAMLPFTTSLLVVSGLVLASGFVTSDAGRHAALRWSDLAQVLLGRKVRAAWTVAALLNLASRGERVSRATSSSALEQLVPLPEGEPEEIELFYVVALLEEGQLSRARSVLRHLLPRYQVAGGAFMPDVIVQAGAAAAFDGDLNMLEQCLEVASRPTTVAGPGYFDLLRATAAQVRGETVARDGALQRYWSAVQSSSAPALMVGGNQWILERLMNAGAPHAREVLASAVVPQTDPNPQS